jgi:hypothetical protein
MRDLLSVLKALFGIGALCCVLWYVADFSLIQSVVLTIFGFALYSMFLALRDVSKPIVPYRIHVMPRWYELVHDFGFVADDEAWGTLWEEIEKIPREPWNVWQSGFSASLITPDLFFIHGWNYFSTRLDSHVSLEPVAIDWEFKTPATHRPYSPSLHLEGSYGYTYTLSIASGVTQKRPMRVT